MCITGYTAGQAPLTAGATRIVRGSLDADIRSLPDSQAGIVSMKRIKGMNTDFVWLLWFKFMVIE